MVHKSTHLTLSPGSIVHDIVSKIVATYYRRKATRIADRPQLKLLSSSMASVCQSQDLREIMDAMMKTREIT